MLNLGDKKNNHKEKNILTFQQQEQKTKKIKIVKINYVPLACPRSTKLYEHNPPSFFFKLVKISCALPTTGSDFNG